MPYRVVVEGKPHLTDDLTLAECERIEADTEESWAYINPFRNTKHLRSILCAFYRRTHDEGEEEVYRKQLGEMKLKAVLGLIDIVPDDLPTDYEDGLPKAEGDTSTAPS